MYELCKKLRDMTPYAPITGSYPLRLDANESFITPPGWLIAKLGAAAASVDFNRYPDPTAAGLCQAFASFYGIDPGMVTAGNGSDELISVLTGCFLEHGERLLTLTPDFSMYGFYGELYEKVNLPVPKDPGFALTADLILSRLAETGARAVLFSNPCNPTGQGMTRDEVRRLLSGTDALVVLDEAYMDFWDQSMLDEVGEYDNLVVLRTCSKAVGMAALRIGFAVAHPRLTTALRAAKSPYNVSAPDQAMGAAVLSEHAYLRACIASQCAQRDALYEALLALNQRLRLGWTLYPPKTNFVYGKVDNAAYIQNALLRNGVAIRRMGDYLRITAPSPTELPVLLWKLEKVLTEG